MITKLAKYQRWFLLIGGLFALAMIGGRAWGQVGGATVRPSEDPDTLYEVARAFDGDTILLANKMRVRLIGVDCPERDNPKDVEPYADIAMAFTDKSVVGKKVRLEFDASEQDTYGRYLAYVWIDKTMLNRELLREGLARPVNYMPNNRYEDEFYKITAEAIEAKRGMWSVSAEERRPKGKGR